ncbi:MAG: hypothetical protein V1909_02360 [Candidatus Micrarchaeota archaeon]
MKILFHEDALRDLQSFEKQLKAQFAHRLDKLSEMPPRRHMKFGFPFHVENITKQARLIYCERGDALYVIRCFSSHKEYERWYRSFR